VLILFPTYNRIDYTVSSIRSVIKDLRKSKQTHRLVVVDNGSKDGTVACLQKINSFSPVPFTLVAYNFNLGKAKAVNNIIMEYGEGHDNICSFDSDLIINSDGCFFDEMEEAYEHLKIVLDCSILCANLTGNSAHNMRLLRGRADTPYGNVLYNPKGGSGVAGGCLVIDTALFMSVGGYRTNQGIYGGNDGFLIADVMAKKPNSMIGMAESISVYHPFEHNKEYEGYKRDTVEKIRKTGFGTTKGFYDENFNGNI